MLVFMKVEPGNILKLFLTFSNFEPQYSYRLYSYKRRSVATVIFTYSYSYVTFTKTGNLVDLFLLIGILSFLFTRKKN